MRARRSLTLPRARRDSDRRYDIKRVDDPDFEFIHSAQWRAIRKQQLEHQPLCEHCSQAGRITPADQVDHKTPPRGDPDLQTDPANLRSLCASCHTRKTRHQGRKGKLVIGVDDTGWAITLEDE